MTDQPCWVSEQGVLAFVEGDLEPEAELAVARHLAECEGCREQAAEFRALEGALGGEAAAGGSVRWHAFGTPFGRMYVAAGDAGLVRLSWSQPGDAAWTAGLEEAFPGRPVVRDPDAPVLREAERQLHEYFAGERDAFDLPIDLDALPRFTRRVLAALLEEVGFGQVVAYSDLARRIGRPRAARAVGNAVGRNPVAIVVPCHRVVRSDGSLGGYGGGVEFKERLLTIEGRGDLLKAG
ncbi:MAG TPA: methylated-DNA--[protein]-cysteine S-methyltransferase [Gemmatimonadota bacterium]|nr:methylated-DNA--[protein]-cysteine S-methyltransferase [Gemmatimonadota bacterium]